MHFHSLNLKMIFLLYTKYDLKIRSVCILQIVEFKAAPALA